MKEGNVARRLANVAEIVVEGRIVRCGHQYAVSRLKEQQTELHEQRGTSRCHDHLVSLQSMIPIAKKMQTMGRIDNTVTHAHPNICSFMNWTSASLSSGLPLGIV